MFRGLQAIAPKKAMTLYPCSLVVSREAIQVHEFFTQLTFIVNIVGASCKQHDQLQAAQVN